MITVFDRRCRNCLFTPDRLVSRDTAAEIVDTCINEETEFACHTDSRHMCHEFYHRHGDELSLVRLARRTGKVLWVERVDDPHLPSFRETGVEDYRFEPD